MEDQLIIKTYNKEGPNGDRASHNTPYKDYQIVFIDQDGNETELVYINGHDNFWCSHRCEKSVKLQLTRETEKFEKVFGLEATRVNLVKKVVPVTEEWIEE